MATVREQMLALLKPTLPRAWKFVPYQRNLDRPSQTTLMLKQSTIQPTPQAPQGAWTVDYVLTIISANTDPMKAEEQLDKDVLTLLDILTPLFGYRIKQATKAQWGDNGPTCYDIDLTFTTSKAKD